MNESLTNIGMKAFYGCVGLLKVDIPNTVVNIGSSAFDGCKNLTNIKLPESLTRINYYTFNNCSKLESIVIPESVSEIDYYAFQNSGLKTLIIPESITIIGGSAFSGCRNLKSVIIPNSVSKIGGSAFSDCTSLTSISIPESITEIATGLFSKCTSLKEIIIPKSVTSIGASAFMGCINVENIIIPNSVKSISSGVFSGCSSLESIEIPESVTKIGSSAFENCTSISSIIIPNKVESIESSLFKGCSNLKSITIPDNITRIDGCAFYGCTNLEIFYCYCQELPSIIIDIFENSNYKNATLYVPKLSLEQYNRALVWKEFGTILSIEGGDIEKCANPIIYYDNGKLYFKCDTEGVEFISEISDDDIGVWNDSEIELSVKYNISVYTTKPDYTNSDTVFATLCWVDIEPKSEGVITSLKNVKVRPVLIQNNDGTLIINGVENELICIYDINGEKVGEGFSCNGIANVKTYLKKGCIAIIKFGNKSIKVLLK